LNEDIIDVVAERVRTQSADPQEAAGGRDGRREQTGRDGAFH
jgi:hypothetical protein